MIKALIAYADSTSPRLFLFSNSKTFYSNIKDDFAFDFYEVRPSIYILVPDIVKAVSSLETSKYSLYYTFKEK